MFSEAQTIADSINEGVDELLVAIDEEDRDQAKVVLTNIEGLAKDLRNELNSIPVTSDVSEGE